MTLRGLLAVLAMVALAAGLGACGAASVTSPPSGVDGLRIPTPSPDPADFVAAVDNPWFPLVPGTTWRYDVTDAGGEHPLTVSVADGPTIAGVGTTARVATEQGRRVTDWYAEDRAGNVWWFGREGSWRAGADGAEAGLAMAETPRVGDGYRQGYVPGVVEDTAAVVALDERVTVPAGTFAVLVVDQRSPLQPGASGQASYAEGVGLVEETVVSGGYRTVRLREVAGH
jgi:hypothetical protein